MTTLMTDQVFQLPCQQPLRDAQLHAVRDHAAPPRILPNAPPDARQDVRTELSDHRRLEQLFDELLQQLDEWQAQRQQSVGELQHVAIDLAIEIADKLVHGLIETEKFPFDQWVQHMTSAMTSNEPLIVQLNPDDHQLLLRQRDLAEPTQRDARLKFESNPKFPRGRCRVESSQGELFYDIGLQLSELRQRIMENLHEAEIERRAAAGDHSQLRRFPNRRSPS